MNILQEHIEYLKDNPEGYWFKRKLYGYGWIPAKPMGWVVFVVYFTFVLGVIICNQEELDEAHLLAVVLGTILFYIVLRRTGESPKWQWGNRSEQNEEIE